MNTRRFLICLICAWGAVSCSEWGLEKQMKEFVKNEIIVPREIKQVLDGRDSIVLNLDSGVAQFVVWVDSVACSSCRLDMMFRYDEIIDFRKDADKGFLPIFVFSPPQVKISEMIQTLKKTRFDYPIFIDERQAFPAANPHIPADNRFHTFLLDKNGKVVLVGDPVNNPALWELYKSTITTLIENGGVMPPTETKK